MFIVGSFFAQRGEKTTDKRTTCMAEDATAAGEPNPELEGLATSVELTLASVLQGIALAILVPKIVDLITSGAVAKLPYIPASLLLLFMVWVMFINHAISFIT